MSLSVIKAGLFDTLQDDGRYGYRHWGVNTGGAMDQVAARMANSIAGNKNFETVLEMHYPAPVLRCNHAAVISVTGADFMPAVNQNKIPLNTPVILCPGDLLSFEKPRTGRISYLAVQGGFMSDNWLGSGSTHIKLGMGGFKGRALKAGDELLFNNEYETILSPDKGRVLPWHIPHDHSDNEKISILPGKEWEYLADTARSAFLESSFTISTHSDRMGFLLNGEKLSLKADIELLSSPVRYGTLQLLPNGQIIVLMADHQTTGGYPRLGHIITAHLGRLAQCISGKHIQFAFMDIATAEHLMLEQENYLQQIHMSCSLKWKILYAQKTA